MTVIVGEVYCTMLTTCLVGSDELVMNVPGTNVLVVSLPVLHLPCHVKFTQIILFLGWQH